MFGIDKKVKEAMINRFWDVFQRQVADLKAEINKLQKRDDGLKEQIKLLEFRLGFKPKFKVGQKTIHGVCTSVDYKYNFVDDESSSSLFWGCSSSSINVAYSFDTNATLTESHETNN